MLNPTWIIFLVGSATIAESAATDKVCKTDSCLETSNMMKQSMDLTVDPCDNFYKYACGNYPKWKEEKHHFKRSFSWIEEMTLNISDKIRDFLRSDLKKSAPQAEKKAQLLFHSCADTEAMDKKGYDRLRDLFKEIGVTPDPPIKVHEENFSWTYSAAKMKRLLNLNFLIQVDVHKNYSDENATVNRIYLKKPSTGNEIKFPYTFKAKSNTMKSLDSTHPFSLGAAVLPEGFFAFIKTLVNVMNGHKNQTEFEEKVIDISLAELATFQVERKISSFSAYLSTSKLAKAEAMTLQELQNLTDTAILQGMGKTVFNWEEYFKTLFDGIEGLNIDLTKEKFFVPDPNYFKALAMFVAEQSPHLMERAIWFDVLSTVAELTTNEMRDIFHGRNGGPFNMTEWTTRCYAMVEVLMPLVILHHFVDDEAVVTTKFELIRLLKHMKIALAIIIKDADWMDKSTKDLALEKIKKMKQQISHPFWLQNVTLLNELYEDIKVYGPNNMMVTYLSWMKSIASKQLQTVGKEKDPKEDESPLEHSLEVQPLQVNAFYNPTKNKMYVPTGIIAKPFYGHEIQALNYGGLGIVIGHEITHGFDDAGRRYNAEGTKTDWWQQETLASYKNRTQCFIDSYSSLKVGEGNLTCDGRRSLNENIADNGGFRESLMAYRYYVKENGEEPLLYGFENFTHEQLYTLSFANIWCAYQPNTTLLTYIRDVHGPNEARVVGTTLNSDEFADIWKCPKGSKENPDKPKCRVW